MSAEQGEDADGQESDNPVAEPKRSLRSELTRRAVVTIVLAVLYFLSFGPAFWLWFESKFIGGTPAWALFYEPLYRVSLAFRPIGRLTAGYVELWWS